MILGVSPISGTVFAGRVKNGLWVGKKTDMTSEFLRCVIEKANYHGGTFEIRGGGEVYTVKVTKETE